MPVGSWVMRTADWVVLTCWPPATGRAIGVDPQVTLVDLDLDLLGLGQHRDGHRRGVDPARRLGLRHALYAVHPGLEFEPTVGATTLDDRLHFLDAADARLREVEQVDPEASALGVAAVHPEQLGGEERRLVATGTGADLEHDVAFVVRILRDQLAVDRRFERVEPAGAGW